MPVKSGAKGRGVARRALQRPVRLLSGTLAALGVLLPNASAAPPVPATANPATTSPTTLSPAGKTERPLLLGGTVVESPREIVIDPLLPRGELRGDSRPFEPARSRDALCSPRRPVCARDADAERRARALRLLEEAYEKLALGAGLPLALEGRDVLWAPGPTPLGLELLERPPGLFDRAWAACAGGALTARDASRCLVEVGLASLSPATSHGLRSGAAVASVSELEGEDPEDRRVLEWAQENPEVALIDRDPRGGPPERSALFFRYLDDTATEAGLGEASWLALSLAATRTPPGDLRYNGEPDLFDVLRASLGGERARFAQLLDDFAAARLHLDWGAAKATDATGAPPALTPRFAWDIDSRSLPKNLSLRVPIEPTGSAYLRVRLEEESPASSLAFRIGCEAPVSYAWSIARLDAAGRTQSRVRVAYKDRGSDFDQRVGPLEDTRALVLIGTNLGGVDLEHPYDPEHGPHEPHGCSVYVARLP